MNEPENSVRESISAEEMVLLPLRQFEGEIVVVENFQETRKAIDYLAKAKVLGFDTETKPTFKKGDSHQVALLQLATQNKAFLFRVMKTGIPDELKKLLADPKILKAGVAIHDDLKALQKIRPFNPGGFIELQNMAKGFGNKGF